MTEIKTESGFKCSIDERQFASWDFIEALKKMTAGNENTKIEGAVDYVNIVMGSEKEALINHIKAKNNGFCGVDDMITEVKEIVAKCKASKN